MERKAPRQVIIRTTSTEQMMNQRTTRKSLKTVQNIATDKENLTGRPALSANKKPMVKDVKTEINKQIDSKRKRLPGNDKTVQAGLDSKIKAEDLTSDAGPSENYWQVLAEKRGVALSEALEENRELHEKVLKLEEENRICKEMLEEANSLAEVLREIVGEQEESGIDLAEASTSSVVDESATTAADSEEEDD